MCTTFWIVDPCVYPVSTCVTEEMFWNILLAVAFLLQISMANDEGNAEYADYNDESVWKLEPSEDTENYEAEEHDYETDGSQPDNAIYAEDIVPCEDVFTHNKEVQDEIVWWHNHYRSSVDPEAANMLKMGWSDKLMDSSQSWAEQCKSYHSQVEDRNYNGNPYGENLLISPACIKWSVAIRQWWNEGKNMVYGVGPKGNKETGHFTQIVTDHTFEMGCAFGKCDHYSNPFYLYACQYYPAGNRPSSLHRPYEKGVWCSHCKTACDEGGKLCLNYCPHVDTHRNCENIVQKGLCYNYTSECKASCFCKNKVT